MSIDGHTGSDPDVSSPVSDVKPCKVKNICREDLQMIHTISNDSVCERLGLSRCAHRGMEHILVHFTKQDSVASY